MRNKQYYDEDSSPSPIWGVLCLLALIAMFIAFNWDKLIITVK